MSEGVGRELVELKIKNSEREPNKDRWAKYSPLLLIRLLVEPMADVTQLTLTDQFLPDGFGPVDRRDNGGHTRVLALA